MGFSKIKSKVKRGGEKFKEKISFALTDKKSREQLLKLFILGGISVFVIIRYNRHLKKVLFSAINLLKSKVLREPSSQDPSDNIVPDNSKKRNLLIVSAGVAVLVPIFVSQLNGSGQTTPTTISSTESTATNSDSNGITGLKSPLLLYCLMNVIGLWSIWT